MTKANQPDNKLFHSPNLATNVCLYFVFYASSQSALEWMNCEGNDFHLEIIDTTLNRYLVNLRYKQCFARWQLKNLSLVDVFVFPKQFLVFIKLFSIKKMKWKTIAFRHKFHNGTLLLFIPNFIFKQSLTSVDKICCEKIVFFPQIHQSMAYVDSLRNGQSIVFVRLFIDIPKLKFGRRDEVSYFHIH